MGDLNLTLAIGEYDHVRDLLDGTVRVAGIDLTAMRRGSKSNVFG